MFTTEQHNPNVQTCATHFMDDYLLLTVQMWSFAQCNAGVCVRGTGSHHSGEVTFPTCACGVRPIAMHCVRWPIRADCACRKQGLENEVFERGGA